MNIIIIGSFFQLNGLNSTNRELAFALEDAGHNVKINNVNEDDGIDNLLNEQETDRLFRMHNMVIPNEKEFCVIHSYNPDELGRFHRPNAKKNIILVYTETNKVPEQWLHSLNEVADEVWVPSAIQRQIFIEGKVKEEKIKVVPFGVDTIKFKPDGNVAKIENVEDDHYILLSVFEWAHRKGRDQLLASFLYKFRDEPNVTLLLKVWKKPEVSLGEKDIFQDIRRLQLGMKAQTGLESKARVKIIPHIIGSDQMPSLYRRADAFVLATRAEGFGTTILEAMACGLPVITPVFGSMVSYADQSNCLPVKIDGFRPVSNDVEMIRRNPWYNGHNWIEPNTGSIAEKMWEVYQGGKGGHAEIRKNARITAEKLDWKNSAEVITKYLAGKGNLFTEIKAVRDTGSIDNTVDLL